MPAMNSVVGQCQRRGTGQTPLKEHAEDGCRFVGGMCVEGGPQ